MRTVDFLLNRGKHAEDTVVDAPAFSLTKVLTIAAPVITAAVALIADKLDKLTFEAVHVTVLTVAVLGFVAIAGSADVIARAVARPAPVADGAAQAGEPAATVRLAAPIRATRLQPGADDEVLVAAISSEQPPRFLCVHPDGILRWEDEADVNFARTGPMVATPRHNGQRG